MYPRDFQYHNHEDGMQSYEIERYEGIESLMDQRRHVQFQQQQYPSSEESSEQRGGGTPFAHVASLVATMGGPPPLCTYLNHHSSLLPFKYLCLTIAIVLVICVYNPFFKTLFS